ncbi:MAG TPA: WYL domain-containing protein [Microthrixaceae bacterium]|nr:WYL domain-containing protein [Microthrixaceae bacterium]
MSRPTASDRLRRLLAVVPWVADRGWVPIEEVCERFAISEKELMADLDLVSWISLPPHTDDRMARVDFADGMVSISLGAYLRQPLRLAAHEALPLIAAGRALVGTDTDSALSSALDKVAATLGIDDETVQVDLGPVLDEVLGTVRTAIDARTSVELDYYSYGRGSHSVRVVDPYRVISQEGNWYLAGWCHEAQDDRQFRLDRIASVTMTADRFEPPEVRPGFTTFTPGPDSPKVTLRLTAEASWVASYFPTERVVDAPDGRVDVTLGVSELRWLARLLVRLGPQAELVSIENATPATEAAIRSLRADTARRVLDRYRGEASETER